MSLLEFIAILVISPFHEHKPVDPRWYTHMCPATHSKNKGRWISCPA